MRQVLRFSPMANSVIRFFLGLALLVGTAAAQEPPRHLFIYHIDVGQGDATLFVSPSGRTLLIDAGNRGKGSRNVVPLLNTLGIRKLDYLIVTHHDADHIGGVDEVFVTLSQVPVAAYDRIGRQSAKEKTKKGNPTQYGEYVGSLERLGKEPEPLSPGECKSDGSRKIDLGEGVVVLVVASNGEVLGQGIPFQLGKKHENAKSVALKLSYGRFDYFIGGDLTGGGFSGARKTKDLESLAASVVGDVDALRINHHGSATSSNKTFLEALKPEVAVISVGTGGVNKGYKHPHRDVLGRLHDLNKDLGLKVVFQTNRGETKNGLTANDLKLIRVAKSNVALVTDGRSYTVNGMTFPVDQTTSIARSSCQPS